VQAGRRWGKTQLAWISALVFMLNHPNSTIWWVSPIYKELIPATKTVRDLTPRGMIAKQLESAETIRYLELVNGSKCFFHSADREDSLRGSGLHGLIIDEAASLKKDRWESELKPSLIDYNGWLIAIGTPKGVTWLTKLFERGQDPNDVEYKSWLRPSYDNCIENGGFIPRSNIDAIANDMPDYLRRQEMFGETLQGEGVVFRHISDRIRDIVPYAANANEQIVVGSDLGKTLDYTVSVAMRLNGEVVGFERSNQVDWNLQRKRVIAFAQKFNNAPLLIDSTGLGDPVYDEMTREYNNVSGYKFTNATKKTLVENLSLMLDNGEIWFPGNAETKEFSTDLDPQFPVLKNELESYTYALLPSGLIQYGAPEGMHDDAVTACALAAYLLKRKTRCVPPSMNVMSGKLYTSLQ